MGSTSRKTLYDIVRECQELDRRSVDVKSLVIEVGPARRPSGYGYGYGNGYVYVYGRVILAAMIVGGSGSCTPGLGEKCSCVSLSR
jgi:hypothetical protein